MRITGEGPTNTTRRPESTVRSNDTSRAKSAEDIGNSKEAEASDKVNLSSQARDIQRAREVAQGAPEVREAKIEAARRALQSGKLNLKGQDLAEKVLEDTLSRREQ